MEHNPGAPIHTIYMPVLPFLRLKLKKKPPAIVIGYVLPRKEYTFKKHESISMDS
jgi:hypothetical protein